MLSESEASELFGDYIDEDSQTVQRVIPLVCPFVHVLHQAYMSASDFGLLFIVVARPEC